MKVHATMVALCLMLLSSPACGENKPAEPGLADSGGNGHEQRTKSACETNRENLSTSPGWQPHLALLSPYSGRPVFRLVAMQGTSVPPDLLWLWLLRKAIEEKGPERPAQDSVEGSLCVRVAGCRIPENSPKYRDPDLNDPPSLYVIVKRGDTDLITSPSKSGWDVTFPHSPELELDVSRADPTKYIFQVWDDQYGDQSVATIEVSGQYIFERFFPGGASEPRKQVDISGTKTRVTIRFEYVGIVRWYRLANVVFPSDSPARKAFEGKPRLQVRLRRDGEELPSRTGKTASVCLPPGWEGTFPKDARHCWKILERSDARYDVAVWDLGWKNQEIFTRSGLRGEEFGKPITEPVGELIEEERAGQVRFERLSRPIEE